MTGLLLPGEAAPWFRSPTLGGRDDFSFDTVAGRHVVMLFAETAGSDQGQAALHKLAASRALFDDQRACFFGVTCDPADAGTGRIARMMPGIRWFLDYDRTLSQSFGAVGGDGKHRPHWLLLDPALRVIARTDLSGGDRLLAHLAGLLAPPREEGIAPVLVVPQIFDDALCRRLIDLYDLHGGKPSGYMSEKDGKTVGVLNAAFKRRQDLYLDDEPDLREIIRQRLSRLLVPLIERAFQFRATRIERYLVACYDGDGEGGYFKPHRDNSTTGTAHRRFACTINLNAGEYEGGDLRFPEFGERLYRAPTGGAVVFSCSLMHEATPVTRGRRYACLPFLYDEAAARLREENAKSGKVDSRLAVYRA